MYEQVRDHILALSDPDLIEYVVTGSRMYQPDAVAFAKEELKRRDLSPDQTAVLRDPIVARVLREDARSSLPRKVSRKPSVVCENCGFEVENRYANYRQTIGLLFVRFTKPFEGRFCRTCNHRLFWKTTLTTFFFGWWELHYVYVPIAILIENVTTFLRTLSVAAVPAGSSPPHYDDDTIAKLAPFGSVITDRLVEQDDIDDIARDVAATAGVSPGQAWCYIKKIRLAVT